MPNIPLNESAVELLPKSIGAGQRVLVLGARGWFGRTFLAATKMNDSSLLCVSRQTSEIGVGGRWFSTLTWSEEILEKFEPTLVLDFASPTIGASSATNTKLLSTTYDTLRDRLIRICEFPSVQRVVSFSSGASKFLPNHLCGNPHARLYAESKRRLEADLRQVAKSGHCRVSMTRVWSVSGGYVPAPRTYAFSSMVLDALEQKLIVVNSPSITYRNYCAVEDVLSLAISASNSSETYHELDTGGEPVEMFALARLIASQIGGTRVKLASPRSQSQPDQYFASSARWNKLATKASLIPLSLEEQVSNVIAAMSVLSR